MKFLACVFIILLVQFSSLFAEVLHLSESEFLAKNDGSSNLLVEFYAPWCGHCKSLAPEWAIAGDTFQPSDDIVIAAVDATAAPGVAKDLSITGYPTIKFFPKGSTTPEDYNGGRTADTIVQWVNNKVGTNRKVKVAPSAVTALTEGTFEQALGQKAALVEFYAPWCGHCKSLAPKYEQLAKVYAGDKEVLIAKVDATENGDLASKYDVKGYPTIKFFPAGASEPEDYNGAREVEDFVTFINEKTGTQRHADGSLKATAGRIPALDEILATGVDATAVQALKNRVAELSGAQAANGKTYVTIAEKVLAKGYDYVKTETARVKNMVGNPAVKPDAKTAFYTKLNILAAFVSL